MPRRHFSDSLSRRDLLTRTAAGVCGYSASGWLSRIAAAHEEQAGRPRQCLLLWMNGGPSQTDTFDLKSGHANGGPFQGISSSVPGIFIGEHLPKVAQWMHRLAVIRSMSTKEGDHGRARDHLRTGYLPQGPIPFPVLGSLVSHECGSLAGDLPNFVSILPRGLFRAGISPAGFLSSAHAPLLVGGGSGDEGGDRLSVENLSRPDSVSELDAQSRLALLDSLQRDFLARHPGPAADTYRTAADRSLRLMSTSAAEAFDLESESAETHSRYGNSRFGEGCLLARRLLERSVPFVEVSLGGWDTHIDNFPGVQNLCGTLDSAWSALLADLDERGLLDSTLIVWMGEFGRTPVINPQSGRDHYPKAWTTVLGGAGIKGGSVVGRTSEDGLTVEDRPVTVPDLLATICTCLAIDPAKQNLSNVGRPIRVVEPGFTLVDEILS